MRPALVLAIPRAPPDVQILWTAMITGRIREVWPDDVLICDRFEDCGLLAPSLVRPAKIAAVEPIDRQPLGYLPEDLWRLVQQKLREIRDWA